VWAWVVGEEKLLGFWSGKKEKKEEESMCDEMVLMFLACPLMGFWLD